MPVVSDAQRRAMYAAQEGKSNLGIPKSVGQEFISASHGLTGLPTRINHHDDSNAARLTNALKSFNARKLR